MTESIPSAVPAMLRALFIGIGSFVLGNVVLLAVAQALIVVGVPVMDLPALQIALSVLLVQGVTFGAVGFLYTRARHGLELIDIRVPDLRDAIMAVSGTVVLFALLFALNFVVRMLGMESPDNSIVEMGAKNPIIFLVLVPLSYLIVAPGEELLYRGLIQGLLRKHVSSIAAIILASVIFAVVHYYAFASGRLVAVGMVAILSLVLGAAYEYSGNLTVPIFIHGTFNAIQFTVAYVAVQRGLL
jgi:membrane protease YdiL (CAAX protease family)